MNKYKANIYTDFTILSFHRPTTHNPLKSTAALTPEPTLPKPHYPPRLAPPHLPPLSKGGGLTARHKPLLYSVLLAIPHHFYTANLSAVKTEGLPHYHPSLAPTPSKTALSHSLFVLQSSVCLYGFAFELSHSLFILQSSVCLYGFTFALSYSLFVGAGSLPRPLHRSY